MKTLVSDEVKVATDSDWKKITEHGLEAITQETLKQLYESSCAQQVSDRLFLVPAQRLVIDVFGHSMFVVG